VEERIHGREVECSVLEKKTGEIAVSLAGEITVIGRDFYDYEAKYLDGGAELRVPTQLTESELAEMHELAVTAFQALGCQGLARTDFFLTDSGFVITEVNTMPGFTPISMYPSLWQASGLSYAQLIEQLIQTGIGFGADPR
jgi:D-alanine-D-alanine ligase